MAQDNTTHTQTHNSNKTENFVSTGFPILKAYQEKGVTMHICMDYKSFRHFPKCYDSVILKFRPSVNI